MFKKTDIFFYILLIFLIIYPFVKNLFSYSDESTSNKNESSKIKIQIGTKYIKYLNSSIDSIYTIEENGAEFRFEVKNKSISVLHSNCKSQICKKTGKITATSNIKQIICIPNKTIISFERSKEQDDTNNNKGLDGISG